MFVKTFFEGSVDPIIYRDCIIVNRRSLITVVWPGLSRSREAIASGESFSKEINVVVCLGSSNPCGLAERD